MRMAVDEARRDDGFAQLFDFGRRESFNHLRARAHARDARAIDGDRALFNRLGSNRQNPTRSVDFRHRLFSSRRRSMNQSSPERITTLPPTAATGRMPRRSATAPEM